MENTSLLTQRGRRIFKIIAINIGIFLALVIGVEMAARVYLHFKMGNARYGIKGRNVHLKYQPFIMFGPDWDQKLAETESIIADSTTVNVLLLGGSTAEGFPTLILQEQLATTFPTKKVNIFNLASPGYNSRQELVTAALWATQIAPDLIITLDGANDLTQRLRVKEPYSFLHQSSYEGMLKKPLLAPLSSLIRNSQFMYGLYMLKSKRNLKAVEEYTDCIPVYTASLKGMNAIAKGLGVPHIMILQPYAGLKQTLSKEEKKFSSYYKFRKKVVNSLYVQTDEALQKLAQTDSILYFNSNRLYEDRTDHIFSDEVHFEDDLGYEILASEIARLVKAL